MRCSLGENRRPNFVNYPAFTLKENHHHHHHYHHHQIVPIFAVASLGWVTPGAATEGVTTLFFPEKKLATFF